MTFHRPWIPLFVAGCLFSGWAEAQQDTEGASPAPAAGGAAPAAGSSTTPGASSAFGASPSTPAAGTIPNAANEGANPNGVQTPGGQKPQNQTLPDTSPQASDGSGSASAFGTTDKPGASQLQQAPASFTVPGFYGRGQQSFTVGEGRLARPRFRFTGNMSVGYDDNVFQTPTHSGSTPAQKVQVEETAGTAAQNVQVLVSSGDSNVADSVQTVRVAAVAPKFRTVTIAAVPEQQRIASWVTRTDGRFDMQFANRRTLFTFDIAGGLDYYWNRPGTKEEYTGSLSLVYLRKLSGRAQFTVEVDASYQSQPDFSQLNTPTSNTGGGYLTTNVKADLSYRLTPRFSTVTSVSYSSLNFADGGTDTDNYGNTTFGTELRYLFSPRVTILGELRYASDSHDTSSLDTSTYYALVGGELALSKRFSASIRVGEVMQEFKDDRSRQSSPYLETTLNYRLTPQSILSWNARYGYEESGAVGARSLVARTGLQFTQIFTPRFQGVLTVNLLRTNYENISAIPTTSTYTGVTIDSNASAVQDSFDASLGFYYTLDRHWSLNLTYSYTVVSGPESTYDYYRQRIFLGAAYQF